MRKSNRFETLEWRQLLDGTLGDVRFLLGDTSIAPIASAESEVQIAAGTDGFLAVWTDRRSIVGTERSAPLNYGWPGGGTDTDIFAVRLDGSGRAIGSSFAVYQGPRADSIPQVDFNGTDYLVSWMSVPVEDQYGKMIQAARVTTSGTVLDTTPIVIDQNASDPAAGVTIAYNWNITHDTAGNWLSVFGGWLNGENSTLGRRISPTGAVLGSASTQLVAGDSVSGGAFFHDGRFVVASHIEFSPVKLRSFTPTLVFVAQTTINHQGQLASNGSDLYMVWPDNVNNTNDLAAFGSRVSDAGQLLDGAVQLTIGHEYSPTTQVTWDGARWQVVTLRASHSATVTHVSPAGSIINPGGTIFADSPQSLISFDSASSNGVTVSAFIDRSAGAGTQDISAAAVLADDTLTARTAISVAVRNQMNVDLATGPGGFLAVYKDLESGSQRILAQRLDTAGHSISPEPIVLSDSPDYIWSPKVAFNGEVYMVVWFQQSGDVATGVTTGTYMRRLDINGTPLDVAPVFVATQYAPDVAAIDNEFLLVSHYSTAYSGYTTWRKFNSEGQILDSRNIVSVGSHTVKQLDVIAVNDRWLVLTENHYNYDASSALLLTWIDRDGNQTTTIDAGVGTSARAYAPHLATSGNNVLMVYDHKTDGSYQDVWARIIGLDNTLGTPFKIGVNGTENSSQSEAHVAWNGSEYIAAWVDHRNKQYPLAPEGDIYATRISEAGVVLDPDGVAVANSSLPDDAPTVHFGHGISLLAFSTFNPAVDAGAMRVAVREIFAPLVLESTSYQFESSPSVNLDFNADVSTTFESTDAVLQNLSTSQLIPSSELQLSFDSWEDAVSIVYSPSNLLTTAPLPDGNYRLTLTAGTIASVTGVPLASDVTIDFFVLAGDVNRDRIVNFNDLLIVAQNYGQPNRMFSQGNVDYSPDGLVNFSDLLIIAQQYGTSLPSLRVGQQFGSTRIALDVLKPDE